LNDIFPGGTINVSGFVWDETSIWTFLWGSDGPTVFLNILNAETLAQRELTVCALSASCFGWLPKMEMD
jgi:hypothetical protein